MSDYRSPHKVAEELADFTDCLLKGEQTANMNAPVNDRDFAQLQETAASIARLAPARDPEPALKNRIRAKLAAEWTANGPQRRSETNNWRPARQVRRFYAIGSVFAIVLLFFVALLIVPTLTDVTPGAAQFKGSVAAVVLVGLGIVSLIIWKNKKKP